MREFKSNIIKEKRKLRNMSQAQLGDIVGSQAMVSRIENGQILPNAQTIFILCNKLEITLRNTSIVYLVRIKIRQLLEITR
ncbi:helix-turn-helix transcriptional regulator [Leuconostoc mesenteroides]|uniref:helix-turn-helix transcriptional regulator n=1 Tax=Leuconostoc mesenteroides TaxID=1245 RepID=UPI001FA83541|nr:helix-turn-helix transcriptional regulator [Leuconostoc mesenteroides]